MFSNVRGTVDINMAASLINGWISKDYLDCLMVVELAACKHDEQQKCSCCCNEVCADEKLHSQEEDYVVLLKFKLMIRP